MQTNELESTLKQAFNWNKATTTCIVKIILSMLSLRTVNLKKLACGIKGDAELNSQYRRLQRFFSRVEFPTHAVAKLMVGLFFAKRIHFIYQWIERIGNGVNAT